MTSDIEVRLRDAANPNGTASIGELWNLCDEAADTIAALKAQLARAKEALRQAGIDVGLDHD